nr:reverse transcriptase domain-containing protein [Tanacetum cinerariifolium]
MVKEGIVLGHKISSAGIEVDKVKVDVISKLPYPKNVKGIRIVYNDHSALNYLTSKQDAKPRLIRWVILLQEFTIQIKDKKGTKNLVADYLSRLENPKLEELDEVAIRDSFPDEHLMSVHVKEPDSDPWYADYANFLLSKVVPRDLTYHLKKKFVSDLKYYIWDEHYIFKSCLDEIIRRCVFGKELQEILEHCHKGPAGGHYWATLPSLRFASKLIELCFKARCVFLQDTLRFASRHAAFCFKTSCVLLQDTCVLSQDSCILCHGGTAFCLLLKTLSAIW